MIYVDSSVVLVHLLGEDRQPGPSLWSKPLTSSRLLEYETWNCLHRYRATETHAAGLRNILGRIGLVEFAHPVVGRALEPCTVEVRTLDALHLATIEYLRKRDHDLSLATYDRRMAAAARALKIPLEKL